MKTIDVLLRLPLPGFRVGQHTRPAPMKTPARLSLLACAIALVAACVPVKEEQAIPLDLRPDNPVTRHIEDLQLAQRRDSLLAALTSANPTERFAAARAFASFQDTSVLGSLVPLLQDQHGGRGPHQVPD